MLRYIIVNDIVNYPPIGPFNDSFFPFMMFIVYPVTCCRIIVTKVCRLILSWSWSTYCQSQHMICMALALRQMLIHSVYTTQVILYMFKMSVHVSLQSPQQSLFLLTISVDILHEWVTGRKCIPLRSRRSSWSLWPVKCGGSGYRWMACCRVSATSCDAFPLQRTLHCSISALSVFMIITECAQASAVHPLILYIASIECRNFSYLNSLRFTWPCDFVFCMGPDFCISKTDQWQTHFMLMAPSIHLEIDC